jgi:uncharacterized protein
MSDPAPMAEPVVLPLEPQREPFWDWIDVALFVVGAPLVVAAVAVLLFTLLKTLHWPATSALALLGMQSLLYVAAFGVLWLILTLRHSGSLWDALRWPVSPITGGRLVLAGFPLAFAVALLGVALRAPKINNPVQKLMSDPASILAVVVFASAIGPAAEEAVFRGFLQPVATRTLGAAGGIALTSLLFAALHGFEYQWCWQYLLLVFMASLAFGWTRLRWNSTGASTLLHAGYNFMFFIGYLFQGRTFPTHG